MSKKYCPIREANNERFYAECMKGACMWWREYAKDCAIPLLADMFADSKICNTVFEQDKVKI